MKEIKNIAYIPNYLLILTVFNNNKTMSINDLHYEYGISYVSLHEMKKLFLSKGWIEVRKENKKHIVSITPKGYQIVEIIMKLITALELDYKDTFNFKRLNRLHKVMPNEENNKKSEVTEETEVKSEVTEESDSGESFREFFEHNNRIG